MNIVISRKNEITVRELGGCMAPIWHNYFKDSKTVMVGCLNLVHIAYTSGILHNRGPTQEAYSPKHIGSINVCTPWHKNVLQM